MTTSTLPLRPPHIVMQLDRLGSFYANRISFARSMIRKINRETWDIQCTTFDIDANGYGTCIYEIIATEGECYSLVVFSQFLDAKDRTDRVIANKWDAAFALCEGKLSDEQVDRLRSELPKQEAGRNQADVLVISRANKSVRNFESIVDQLANGQQPNPDQFSEVGYIYRTTAVYGNGKFGIADYAKLKQKQSFKLPFSAQMFAVWLFREFTIQLVNHVARCKQPTTAVSLDSELHRYVGVGNATGLGMAPFLVKHPQLIHQWMLARETALARACHETTPTAATIAQLTDLLDRAHLHIAETNIADVRQTQANTSALAGLDAIKHYLNTNTLDTWVPLADFVAAETSVETQEIFNSLLIELYPDIVDDLENTTGTIASVKLNPTWRISTLIDAIETRYRWVLAIDFDSPESTHYFWYYSQEKKEPRLGVRAEEPGADKEMPVTIARDIAMLYRTLQQVPKTDYDKAVIRFILAHPEHKETIRRVQSLETFQYGEVQANLLNAECLPIHLLRAKLAMFGAGRFDPKSNLWTRITLFQGAPRLTEIGNLTSDDWSFPCKPRRNSYVS